MSSEIIYKCDHCGAKCKGDEYASTGRWDEPGIIVFGKTVHGCSREHLGIALAKMFGISINGEADELLNRKQRELTKLADANSFLVTEHDNMRARIAELEARMPANEVTNVERAQYDRTIELQRKRIEELETSEAVSIERLARIEEPAQRLVAIDNELAEGRDAAAKALFHDSVMRPIEELRGYFGNVARAEKRGQTIFEWEVERRKRVEKSRDELQARVAELEKRIAGLTAPIAVDGKTPGTLARDVFCQGVPDLDSRVIGGAAAKSWERAALAVLRAFGQPSQTQQDTAKVLRKVRDRIESSGAAMFQDEKAGMDAIEHAASIIDEELEAKPTSETPACFLCGKGPHEHTMMTLESLPEEFEVTWCNGRRQNFGTEKPAWWDAPKSDHVHEIKSRSFCDKQAPTPAQAQKRFKYDRAWLSEQTDDALFDLYMDHVGFFDMNGTMLQRENMIETLAALEQEQAITLPTKPTKPLREGDR